ncbi:MAG: hypothetical protein CUN55_04425 [Phototrophicales bacterium]|nr:MAG: hypothetical protein CUN55_04425 [Phototrophicales bacterium]
MFHDVRRLWMIFIILIWIMISCTANRDPIITTPFPTNTFTPLPPTLTPTRVRLPTSTPFPTDDIFAITPIARSNASPTSPLGPTYTPAPPTQTFTPAPTLIGLEIVYFTSNNEAIAPGDNVTLFWQVRGAQEITIYRINEEGERNNPRPVEAEGSITLSTDPAATELVQFVLVAQTGNFIAEETVEIEISCEGEWFFSPAPGGCPSEASLPSAHAEQVFQNGLMIWSSITNEIFIFYSDNQIPTWQRFTDAYTEGLPEIPVDVQPPQGLLLPVRGFGLIWRTNPTVQNRLGFALTPEVGYSGIIQAGTDTNGDEVLYIQRENGEILQLLPEGSSWQTIVPETFTESE